MNVWRSLILTLVAALSITSGGLALVFAVTVGEFHAPQVIMMWVGVLIVVIGGFFSTAAIVMIIVKLFDPTFLEPTTPQ